MQENALDMNIFEKDLGIVIINDIKFFEQCIEVEKKVQKILGYI